MNWNSMGTEPWRSGGKIHLRSRNGNDFSLRYPGIVKALASMRDETVIDGEVVAIDENGRPPLMAYRITAPLAGRSS
jgi:bifunctional non-homologous end joining protein LigD